MTAFTVALVTPWASGILLALSDGRRRVVAWLAVAAIAVNLGALIVLGASVLSEGPVRATPDEHAVLLVGYDANRVYVNDPLAGQARRPVARSVFRSSWQQLGGQALSVRGVSLPTTRSG